MARSSGKVGADDFEEKLAPAGFSHARTGARYRVSRTNGGIFLEFSRNDRTSGQEIKGQRRLDYFIGSGVVGRSYFFALDRFLFQAPVSYYAVPAKWDISPGYEKHDRIHVTRSIEPECLNCHASGLQHIVGTQNRYEPIPFLEGGVGCERCHGPGEQHLDELRRNSGRGARAILNPLNLAPEERDSICAQCHLTGEARVAKRDRSLTSFRPGDRLADHVISFIWPDGGAQDLKVTSHFEKLWQSACKKKSGDRFWCGSCHDPHSVPGVAERREFFRQRCLTCHTNSECKSTAELREKSGNDCVSCHMPKNKVVDVAHSVYTDHSIPRVAGRHRAVGPKERSLVSFWGGPPAKRELGLAYAELAVGEKNGTYAKRAMELLRESESATPDDAAVLVQLAYLYDRKADDEKAIVYYQRALAADPGQVVPSVNLGALLAKRGNYRRAIDLWEGALSRNPGLELARIYLAQAFLRLGSIDSARAALLKSIEYDPDSPLARKLLSEAAK